MRARPQVRESPRKPDGHIPALDAVRGVAILLVMWFHFTSYGSGGIPSFLFVDRLYFQASRAGWIGVDLFFVLSGFLITGILYDVKGRRHGLRSFYARRILRIFPLYYAALTIFLVVVPALLPEHAGAQSMTLDGVWYWTYLSNVKIALDGWPAFGAIGHFWSLAVEEQFYLLWPVLVFKLNRAQLQAACIVCIVGALGVRSGLVFLDNATAAFVLTPARIDALAVGAYLALAARGPIGLRRYSRWAGPVVAVLSSALLAIFVLRRGFEAADAVVSTVGITLVECLFGAMLVLALTTGNRILVAAFDSSVLQFLGRYSYGLYVFHHPILFFAPAAIPLGIVPTVFGSQLLRRLVFLLVATGISVSMAWVSWHACEKHFLKLKTFFPYAAKSASAEHLGVAAPTGKARDA